MPGAPLFTTNSDLSSLRLSSATVVEGKMLEGERGWGRRSDTALKMLRLVTKGGATYSFLFCAK